VSIGEVVTYVRGGLPVLRRFFRRVHDALSPGGLLLFDFMHSARGRTYPARTMRGTGWSMTVQADYSARTRTLTRHIDTARRIRSQTHRGHETHTVRIYDRLSMVSVLRRTGFHVSTSRSIGPCQLLPGDTAVVARLPTRRTAAHRG
jgi:hypothetical protein